jgi:hypothetical protein
MAWLIFTACGSVISLPYRHRPNYRKKKGTQFKNSDFITDFDKAFHQEHSAKVRKIVKERGYSHHAMKAIQNIEVVKNIG